MKELDRSTLELVRYLDKNHERFVARYRHLVVVVVWLDGDEDKLRAWAQKHKIENVALSVIPRDDSTLDPWKLSPAVGSVTVQLTPQIPQRTFIDLKQRQFAAFEAALDKNFKQYIRK